jgi:hypothetical protein
MATKMQIAFRKACLPSRHNAESKLRTRHYSSDAGNVKNTSTAVFLLHCLV